MDVRIRRVYEDYEPGDGQRVLVDGLWPRGMARNDPRVGVWMSALAPSAELRQSFNHVPDRWPGFVKAYHRELLGKPEAINDLLSIVADSGVTLVFAAREVRFNNAVALRNYLEKLAES